MPVRGAAFAAALLVWPLAVAGQGLSREETLADMRQQLQVLAVDLQSLRRELSTTGAPGQVATAGSVLDRVVLLEQTVQALTARTEELQFRIDRIVADGTNRIGDLEFRLCELEAGCDIGALGDTSTLGGGAGAPPPRPAPSTPTTGGPQLAVGEREDFDRAKAALDAGDYGAAADLFAVFAETYPGGPMTAAASFHRGEALGALGETGASARAYLTAFSSDPEGPQAASALLRLGRSLAQLGQGAEACVTLGEVGTRFPGSAEAQAAVQDLAQLGCG